MRSIFFALTLAVAAAEVSAADAPPSCKDTAMTQTDMNVCSGSDFQKADAQLHAVYQSVLSKHRGDKAFIQNLQTAQRAWLAWRDAEMRDIFPDWIDLTKNKSQDV